MRIRLAGAGLARPCRPPLAVELGRIGLRPSPCPPWRARARAGASDGSEAAPRKRRAGGARPRRTAPRRSSPATSNFRPNWTEGSKKPDTASKGTTSFSGELPKDSPTSKPCSLTCRSQNWCCRTMVISSGYFSASRVEILTPGMLGLEGDVEMVLARKPLARGVRQHPSHHRAQRILRQKVVADVIGGHRRSVWQAAA